MTGAPESGSKTTGTKGGDAPASQANGESKGPAPANAQADVPAPTPTPDDPPKPKSSSRLRGRRRKNEAEVAKAVAASSVTTIDGAAPPALEPVDPASTDSPEATITALEPGGSTSGTGPAPEPVHPAAAPDNPSGTSEKMASSNAGQVASTESTDGANASRRRGRKRGNGVTNQEPAESETTSAERMAATGATKAAVSARASIPESVILLDLNHMLQNRTDPVAIRKALCFYGLPIVCTYLGDIGMVENALRGLHADRRVTVFNASIQHGDDDRAAGANWRKRFGDYWAGMTEPAPRADLAAKGVAFFAAVLGNAS